MIYVSSKNVCCWKIKMAVDYTMYDLIWKIIKLILLLIVNTVIVLCVL